MVVLCHGRGCRSGRSHLDGLVSSCCRFFLRLSNILVGHHLLIHADLTGFDTTIQNGMVERCIHVFIATYRIFDTRLFQSQVVSALQCATSRFDLADPVMSEKPAPL